MSSEDITPPSPSPERLADLKRLVDDHGISLDMISSLSSSKEEARAHIGFFKKMMFVSNGIVMTIGLSVAGFGLKRLMDGFSVLGLVCAVLGLLLFLKFTSVFVGMARAIKATEAVARKHELI